MPLSSMRKIVVSTLSAAMLIVTACAHSNGAQEWKMLENDAFSFSIPATFQNTNARGFDSYVEVYVSGTVVLSFDYVPVRRPMRGNNLRESWAFYGWPAETTFEDLKISGKPARIGMAKHESYAGYPYSAKIYIDTGPFLVDVIASCKSEAEYALVKRIVETISFKESKSSP